MGAAREKDQADFDLERFVDMFDEAMTSKDPRIIDALRSLMMIVTLTRPEVHDPYTDRQRGPLRRLAEDVNHLNRRLMDLEHEFRSAQSVKERVYAMKEQMHAEETYPNEKYVARAQRVAQIEQDAINELKLAAQSKGLGLYKK